MNQERKKGKKNLTGMKETAMKILFLVCACISILSVIVICVFLFAGGFPAIAEIGFFEFIFGTTWRPTTGQYGILTMIVGSIYVTAGAIIIGVPLGLLAAVFLAYYCPPALYRILKPAVELLAGIPSIVYGFFALVVIVPAIRGLFGGSGMGILTASILLGMMILPTIVGVSESALRALPDSYYEGALALGATHEKSIFFTCIPAAKSGIFAGVILGVGRAIGETMAVVMIAGNSPIFPTSVISQVRTLTANVIMEMGYATGLHREALIATGTVLFVFIMIINISFSLLKNTTDRKERRKKRKELKKKKKELKKNTAVLSSQNGGDAA